MTDHNSTHIYHRRSIRLKEYDYSQAGLYFITICCYRRACLFGQIVGTKNSSSIDGLPMIVLNDAGKMARQCWLAIPNHFPNAVLHEYVIMPNHIHGIIELTNVGNVRFENNIVGVENNVIGIENVVVQFENNIVGVENFQPLLHHHQPKNEFQKIIPRSIGSIVRGFKIGVTKWMKQNADMDMVWQRNYYEHIIRNRQSYQTISAYIINNPQKWQADKFYTE